MRRVLYFGLWLGLTGGVGAVDLLVNGGFEAGAGDDADGWSEGVIGEGTTLVREAGAGVAGSVAMVGRVDYVSGTGTKTELRQDTGAGSVVGGEDYTLGFQARGAMGPGGVAWFEVFWFDADGSPVGGSGLQNLFADLTEEYQGFGGVFRAPDDADSAEVSIRLEGGAFEGSSGELAIDDVVFDGVSPVAVGDGLNLEVQRDGAEVVLSWDSEDGKVYDIRGSETMEGSSRAWPVVVGEIAGAPGRQVERVVMLEGGAEFFVVVEREP